MRTSRVLAGKRTTRCKRETCVARAGAAALISLRGVAKTLVPRNGGGGGGGVVAMAVIAVLL